MKTIGVLENTIQEYAWGSHSAIPELLGKQADQNRPQAELWMGAHPKAPSRVKTDGKEIPLTKIIADNPEEVLGESSADKFNNKLPFLFKVLAAGLPLSIQAHPDKLQAEKGFRSENEAGISLSAFNRNYKDDNHKPECICALSSFWALNGFRRIADIISLMDPICPKGLAEILNNLKNTADARGLKNFFHALVTLDAQTRKQVIADGIKAAAPLSSSDPIFEWMVKLHKQYPEDIGVFSPAILNLVRLEPDQAMFLPAGELHAYLDGLGIELMANSDNVLRGGLTPKHVDVPELLKVLNFEERDVEILTPARSGDCEKIYPGEAEEFVLSKIRVEEGTVYTSTQNRSAEILLCTRGQSKISEMGKSMSVHLERGISVIVPASVDRYRIKGDAVIYKAAVPV